MMMKKMMKMLALQEAREMLMWGVGRSQHNSRERFLRSSN